MKFVNHNQTSAERKEKYALVKESSRVKGADTITEEARRMRDWTYSHVIQTLEANNPEFRN